VAAGVSPRGAQTSRDRASSRPVNSVAATEWSKIYLFSDPALQDLVRIDAPSLDRQQKALLRWGEVEPTHGLHAVVYESGRLGCPVVQRDRLARIPWWRW
jgi:hypothetical protein